MPCIYLTINHHNKDNGIEPYLYSGSDQNDNPAYLGSSKRLQEDIAHYGPDKFEKTILHEFGAITNKELREFESNIQREEGHKADSRYYNLTDIPLPGGGKKGMKHSERFPRSDKWKESRKGWNPSAETREIWSAQRIGRSVKESTKEIWKHQRSGKNNPYYGKTGKDHPITGFKHSDEERQQRAIRTKQQMASNAAKENIAKHTSKTFIVTTPTGEQVTVTNLSRWCLTNNVLTSRVRNERKGWKCQQI
jgi:hypothetical protein